MPESTEKAKQACLHIATILGSTLDELTVVGGLVPTLLVAAQDLPDGFSPHIGTLDLDLGLSLALLDEALYATVAAQLRQSGFRPDVNEKGNPTLQRWRPPEGLPHITVDFLIPVSAQSSRPDRIMKLEPDFGAVVTAGLQLVGRDRRKVAVSGTTLTGAKARREMWVCGPAAYVILKARAIHGREKSKDAYDLCYILQCHADRLEEVASIVAGLLDDHDAREAMTWLTDDFAHVTALGPERFLGQPQSAALREDAVGLVQELLRLVSA